LGTEIAGYDFGKVPRSPLSLSELRELETTLGFTARDREVLARASAVISDHAEELVDGWRATIGAHEFLAKWFFAPDGKPDEHYKAAVKSGSSAGSSIWSRGGSIKRGLTISTK
jgi:hypothetical protein